MGSEKAESSCASPWLKISKEVDPAVASAALRFVDRLGASTAVPPKWDARGSYDPFFRNFIKILHIQPGRISISVHAKPPICVCKPLCKHKIWIQDSILLALFSNYYLELGLYLNTFGTLHGGSVGTLTEILSTACARTVVAEDKELFLGEISMSYMSATPANEEVLANASVVKSGRNLTVVAVQFKLKKSGNMAYSTRATFYNMPLSSL
ncbi:uncharacterized protein HKW66_Vig0171660 [Vigna angularis]|uniref:Thioesterase domain-containing protein n=1 Tax=Phaseolus angularis TaxID=3914 RepID=A0A8T0JT61_PHAAN|nr:uncharacterized protein HKW66_Vig0171660 [Vigna angularis]